MLFSANRQVVSSNVNTRPRRRVKLTEKGLYNKQQQQQLQQEDEDFMETLPESNTGFTPHTPATDAIMEDE